MKPKSVTKQVYKILQTRGGYRDRKIRTPNRTGEKNEKKVYKSDRTISNRFRFRFNTAPTWTGPVVLFYFNILKSNAIF